MVHLELVSLLFNSAHKAPTMSGVGQPARELKVQQFKLHLTLTHLTIIYFWSHFAPDANKKSTYKQTDNQIFYM